MIISLSGKARTGKDTFANTLVSEKGFIKISFAQNLKRMCQWTFGLSVYQTDTQEGKEATLKDPIIFNQDHLYSILSWMRQTHNLSSTEAEVGILAVQSQYVNQRQFKSARDILQFVGTDVIRNINEAYHVEIVENLVKNSDGYNLVSVDSRFPNERKMLKQYGARLVLINRPDTQIISNHASETSLEDQYDLIVNNNASLKELAEMARYSIKPLILVGEINGDEIFKYPRRNKVRH